MKPLFIFILLIISMLCHGQGRDSLLVDYGQGQDEFDELDWALLGAQRDFLTQVSDFSFNFVRFSRRGYPVRYEQYRWQGMALDDLWSGAPPWNIMGGASSLWDGQGGKVGASFSNRTYTYKAMAGYNAVLDKKGWSFGAQATRGWGRSLSIEGVFADTWTFFGRVSKRFGKHEIGLTALYAPTVRGMQSASTAEAFALVGNNLYNPNWGWQGDKQRTARVRKANIPIATLSHTWHIAPDMSLTTSVLGLVGRDSYSAMNWQNAQNPNPDYYRYMPCYQTNATAKAELTELWQTDSDVQQIDYQSLYDTNYDGGQRAHYILEDRVRRRGEVRFESMFSLRVNKTKITAGIEATWGTQRNYKQVKDLLGGQYWLDIDQFIEQDDDLKDKTQNNMLNPDRHVGVGDRFGYDYKINVARVAAVASVEHSLDKWLFKANARLGMSTVWREGFYEKENFAGQESFGRSPSHTQLLYNVDVQMEYRLGGRGSAGVKLFARGDGITPRELFLSPNYRNAFIDNPRAEALYGVEIFGVYRVEKFKASASLYLTQRDGGTQTASFYDDLEHCYAHYVLQGLSQNFAGLELGAEIMVVEPLWLGMALLWSDNRYSNDPVGSQYRESSGAFLRSESVAYQGLHVAGSPQSVGVVSLSYRPSSWVVSLSANAFGRSFISPSPALRTPRAQAEGVSTRQEQFSGGFTLDIFGGKSFYFRGGQRLGIYAGVNNMSNNRSIKSGGYESSRLLRTDDRYTPQASKYYYALGINGFVNVSLTF